MSTSPTTEQRQALLQDFVKKLKTEVEKDRSIWIVERLTHKSGILVKGKLACCYSDQPVGLVIVVCKAEELTKDLTNPDLLVVESAPDNLFWVDTVANKSYLNEDLVKHILFRIS